MNSYERETASDMTYVFSEAPGGGRLQRSCLLEGGWWQQAREETKVPEADPQNEVSQA